MRPIGEIYCDLEVLLDEMIDDHQVQMGDVLHWVHGHLQFHRPDCIEQMVNKRYMPVFSYKAKRKKKR